MTNHNYTSEIATRLKAFRTSKKISQEKMAELLGITYATYKKIESANQNITMKNLIGICKILDISADALIFGNMDKTETFNFDEFIMYANFFNEESLESLDEVIQKILKLKKLKNK